jgi:hypothetical protein
MQKLQILNLTVCKKSASCQHASNAVAGLWFIARFFFLTSFSPSGENYVPKPRLRLARKRWEQLVPKKPEKYWQKFLGEFFF